MSPTLLVHATGDPVVQYSQTTRYARALRAKGITTVVYPVVSDSHDAWAVAGVEARVLQFLRYRLR